MILSQFDVGLHPEFGFTRRATDVDMNPRLLAREEKESKTPIPEYRWTQRYLWKYTQSAY